MKILVTGVAGFVGSHCAEHLLKSGHDVCGFDDLSGGSLDNLFPEVDYRTHSICDSFAVDRMFEYWKPDIVVHAAAFAAENLSHNCRSFTYSNNLVGSANIINACIKNEVKCMINLSSIAVYGKDTPPFTESQRIKPADPYGIAKLAVDMDLRCAKEFFGTFNYVTLKLQNVIGIRQNAADKYRNVASILIRSALEGTPMPIFGDGTQTRSFTPVDHVAAIVGAIPSNEWVWNNEFNVACTSPMSVIDLAKMICRLTGVEENFNFLPARKESVTAFMDTGKCDSVFGNVYPNVSVETCLSEMIEFCRSRGFGAIQKGPEIEIKTGMPQLWI